MGKRKNDIIFQETASSPSAHIGMAGWMLLQPQGEKGSTIQRKSVMSIVSVDEVGK